MFLTPQTKIKDTILKEYHDNPLSSHQGYFKTYKQIREKNSWKGLKKDFQTNVQECMTCQRNKAEQTHPTGLLQPLPILNRKWESI